METDAPQRGGVAENIDLEYVTPVPSVVMESHARPGLDSRCELRPFAFRIVLTDLAKLTPAELDALKRRHRAALAVLGDVEQEQRPLLLAAVVWPSEAVERALSSLDDEPTARALGVELTRSC